MKTLLLTFLTLVAVFSARAEPQEQTADELLRNVRAELPKGWTASYNKQLSLLKVSRDEPVSAWSALPNGPLGEKPEPRKFAISFRVAAAISPAEYHRLSAENAKILKEMDLLYESLVKRQVTHKFDSFLPRTDSERADVRRYEALKASLHSLPDFYFRDISLKLQPGSTSAGQIHVADDKVRNECTRVQEKIEKLLSKYDDA